MTYYDKTDKVSLWRSSQNSSGLGLFSNRSAEDEQMLLQIGYTNPKN